MKCGWFCWQSCCFQSCVCYLLMRVFSALVNLEGWDVSGQSELGDAISCGIHRWESGCKGLQTDPLSNLPCQLSDGCKCEKDETLSPLLTQHKHRSHRNFHIISYRSVWEISMSPHFLVMDSEWDTATSAMFATISCHDCGFAALCDLFAFLPTSCIGEWLPKDAKSRCLFKYDFTCRAWELQDSWLQSQKLDHRRRSGSFSAKMYGSTECLGVLVV